MSFYGCDVSELASEYGTPLYIISEENIRERCREMKSEFLDRYENTKAVYASKACQILEVLRIIASEGIGLDVVSGGELYAALKAGYDPSKIEFHGNTKSERELKEALNAGVGTIVVDNLSELALLDRMSGEAGIVSSVLLRVTPGVDSHTHEYISTGQLDSNSAFLWKRLSAVRHSGHRNPRTSICGDFTITSGPSCTIILLILWLRRLFSICCLSSEKRPDTRRGRSTAAADSACSTPEILRGRRFPFSWIL